jgi:hypothetical protein
VLVHELIHLLISVLIASFFWWRYRDLRLFFVVLVIGIFIDVDHWFDYFAWFGLKINLRNFFNVASYIHPSGKVYIPLHGWEWLPIFWLTGKLIGRKIRMKGLEWAISLSFLGHLLWDNFSFIHSPFAYFFVYRWLNDFSLKSFNGVWKF